MICTSPLLVSAREPRKRISDSGRSKYVFDGFETDSKDRQHSVLNQDTARGAMSQYPIAVVSRAR